MKFKTILRYIVLAGIFVVPFLPFFVANSMYFPFISGKNFAFRIIIEIIFACWLILALSDKSYAPKKSPIMWAYSAFMAIVILADIFGVNPYRSFWSNYERMEGLIAHLHFFAYFLVLGSTLSGQKLWDAFWKTSIGASLIMVVYGFAQLGGVAAIHQGGVRLDGTFGNAAYLAVYMLFNIFLSAYYLAHTWKKPAERWIYMVTIPLQFIILFYTATRGSLLGLLGGVFLSAVLLVIAERKRKKLRNISIGIGAALIVLVLVFIAMRNVPFIKNNEVLGRFASISLHDKTTESRFMIWNMAWQGVLERPVLGWGQENFNLVFNKFYNPKMYDQEQWFDRTHNIVFDWLIDAGFLGAIGYFALFGLIIYGIWKTKQFSSLEKSILVGMMAGYFVHNFFVFDNLVSYIIYFSIAGWIYSLQTEEKRAAAAGKPMMNMEVVNYGLAPVAAVALILCVYFLNTRPIQANETLIQALQNEKDPQTSLMYYQKAIGYGTFGSGEARERLVIDAPNMAANASADVKSQVLSYAASQMEEQIKAAPNDARYELFLASFYDGIGDYDDALVHVNRALEESPKKQAILIEKGVAYIGKKDYQDALAAFKEAYDLEPDYTDAKTIYAAGAAYAGDKDLAMSLLSGLSDQDLLTDDRALGAYAQLGDYDKVLQIYQLRLANHPEKDDARAQIELSIAATYMQLGRKTDAIAALQQIASESPQYASQIQQYIDDIKAGKNPVQQ
ncbi:MAG TPA: O-antigen ligase family protein [Candidatus Paceibacterota bacterium]|nr:O-antigen ligase family protein [Candidatus Paceibacterota bacterium]